MVAGGHDADADGTNADADTEGTDADADGQVCSVTSKPRQRIKLRGDWFWLSNWIRG